MSRPLRIEYPNAWYHVMNRGAGYRNIFSSDTHRMLFLDLLSQISKMFRVEIHGFCLMGNHYHLLIHTPEGNLQRAMRHLNGVYTQRHNRLETTDGPLFRGRYKAILIEPDAYLLNVSRYIHLNPVVAGVTSSARTYQWSSYRYYMGAKAMPEWLHTKFVLNMLGRQQRRRSYRSFVEKGVDDETQLFYGKNKLPAVMGSDTFRESICSRLPVNAEIPEIKKLRPVPSVLAIIQAVSLVFASPEKEILQAVRGRGMKSHARSAGIYCCRKFAGLSLNEIATAFGLSHYGSVSGSVARFERQICEDAGLAELVHEVEKKINE
ncbi:REP element-mobilizing transposase RayT [Nitrosomonas marina]|uniref:REP element-mobilizing transposase RayT n=1 Tax=Nitrosomonas marina TaxID=917 RepID=A0A1I0DV43_9PROT|nr:transposase [Nitrosomonas marina]SET36507.1 REP element-mobilizing transposase RayT [Nitrosomonas marina]